MKADPRQGPGHSSTVTVCQPSRLIGNGETETEDHAQSGADLRDLCVSLSDYVNNLLYLEGDL